MCVGGELTWIIQPAIAPSPRSLTMNPITDPAATTTKTCAMMLKRHSIRMKNLSEKADQHTHAKQVTLLRN